jgi:hypothetical protein
MRQVGNRVKTLWANYFAGLIGLIFVQAIAPFGVHCNDKKATRYAHVTHDRRRLMRKGRSWHGIVWRNGRRRMRSRRLLREFHELPSIKRNIEHRELAAKPRKT